MSHGRNRRVYAAAGFGVFQRIVQIAGTLVIMPVMLRALGAAGFGIWGAAASLAWLSGVIDLGMGSALVTLVARSLALGQAHEARRQIASALALGASLAVLLLLLSGTVWLRTTGRADTTVYFIAVLGLCLNLPLNSANNVWMALQEGYYSSFWELVQTVVTTVGLLLAAVFARDLRLLVAIVYGGLVASNLGSLIHLLIAHPELRPDKPLQSWRTFREVASTGSMFFLITIAGSLSFVLDNVLALQMLGPEASARMTIATRMCVTAMGGMAVISQPLWPAFTDAAHRSDRHWILGNSTRWMALLVGAALAGSAILVLFGERLLRLWLHADLGFGPVLMWAIAAWIVAQALVRIPNLLLSALLLVRFQAFAIGIGAAIAIALKVAFARSFGVGGILWGTTLAGLLIVLPANLWRIRRWQQHVGAEPAMGAALNARDPDRDLP